MLFSSLFSIVAILALCWGFTNAFEFMATKVRPSNRLNLAMKGKGGKVPINQRGEYMKRQKILEQQSKVEQTKDLTKPIFKIYVRPITGGMWIPCGDLQGDQRATALVNAWMSGFMSDMYKNQLASGIARSIFAQEDTFAKSIIENFKPFKSFTKNDLVFGYKVEFPGLEEKVGEQSIKILEKEMAKNWLDNVKEGFSNIFGGKDE